MHQQERVLKLCSATLISLNFRNDVSDVSKKRIWRDWELLRWDVCYLNSEYGSFLKKRLLSSFAQMNANIRWSSPKQISFSKKDGANALSRSFSINIYRTLSLSTMLSPIEKRFVRKLLHSVNIIFAVWMFCIRTLFIYGVSSWHQIILCRKEKFCFFQFSEQGKNLSNHHYIISSLHFAAKYVFKTVQNRNKPTLSQ